MKATRPQVYEVMLLDITDALRAIVDLSLLVGGG
jgi:hypothetical protein